MSFRLRHEQHANAFGKDPTIWVLDDDAGNRLDVWPALGFNAFGWTVNGIDILDCDPSFFKIEKPTRSGWPILFPFPNRIRAGRFTHVGRDYQLPLNCPTHMNAIHGFALNEAWAASVEGAEMRGVFDLNTPLWPAPARLHVTYRLKPTSLEVSARVESLDQPLPFGIGYHPYFRLAPFGGDDAVVTIAADEVWELKDNLPTGRRLAAEPSKDLRGGRRFGDLTLDDAYTSLTPRADGWIAGIKGGGKSLDMYVDKDFHQFVAFTPPHRRSIALEPYTCATDAIHLSDAGWMELPPRQTWQASVKISVTV